MNVSDSALKENMFRRKTAIFRQLTRCKKRILEHWSRSAGQDDDFAFKATPKRQNLLKMESTKPSLVRKQKTVFEEKQQHCATIFEFK